MVYGDSGAKRKKKAQWDLRQPWWGTLTGAFPAGLSVASHQHPSELTVVPKSLIQGSNVISVVQMDDELVRKASCLCVGIALELSD